MTGYRVAAGMTLAAFVLAGPASAASLPAGGMTPKEVQAWLLDSGYQAELDKVGDESYLKSTTDDVTFEVHFYDCKDGRCASIQFNAGFDIDGKITADQANEWNSEKRYIDCFVDEEGDPWFTYDVNLSPGGTRESLDDAFAVWLSFVPDMRSMAGW